MTANVEPGMWKEVTNFTWRIQNYSKLESTELYADTFLVAGYKWRFLLFPKGKGGRLAARLIYADSKIMPDEWSIPADIRLTLVNQLTDSSSHRLSISKNLRNGTSFGGLMNFVLISHLRDKDRGFLADDTLIIEAAVSVVEPIDPKLSRELSSALFNLRDMISKESGVEPYQLNWCINDAFVGMCHRAPRTKKELLKVKGIEREDVIKYGDRLLQTIAATVRDYCEKEQRVRNGDDIADSLSPQCQEVSKASYDPEVTEPEVEDQSKGDSSSPPLSSKDDQTSTTASPSSSSVQFTSKNLLAEISAMASSYKSTSADGIHVAANNARDGSATLHQQREKLAKFLEMSVEEICQSNWFDNVQEVVLKIYELATESYEKTVLKNLLSRLVEFRNNIPESLAIIESSCEVEASSEHRSKELEGNLLNRQKQLAFLDSEASRIEEERMKVKAEIQVLVALEDKLVHEKNSALAEMEDLNREVSRELGELKRKRTQHKEALENRLRAKERLAQFNTSWKLFKENLGL